MITGAMGQEYSSLLFHEGTRHPGGRLLDPRHQYTASMRPHLFKDYEGLAAIPLELRPSPSKANALSTIGSFSDSPRPPEFDDLCQLLHFSAGITKLIRGVAFRAAACTGALYHIELYVVCRDLMDLEAGVYHFDPMHSNLVRLRSGDFRRHLVEATAWDEAVQHAPVTVVFTDVFWRNAIKYQARAYRHSFWDSGTMLANMLATSRALRLVGSVVMGFVDREVADLLGVDLEEELPLALVPIGRGAEVGTASAPGMQPVEVSSATSARSSRLYPVIADIHKASALADADAVEKWRRGSAARLKLRIPEATEARNLEPISERRFPEESIEQAIQRRGSSRRFVREALTFGQISTILDRSIRPIRTDYESIEAAIQPFMIVNDVNGISPGLYEVQGREGSSGLTIKEIRTGQFRSQAAGLALNQPLGGDAAVNLYFLADLEAFLGAYGDRGYRLAQTECAIMAGWGYLSAYALGLGATGLTFFDEHVKAFIGDMASGLSVMFLLALGVPSKRPTELSRAPKDSA